MEPKDYAIVFEKLEEAQKQESSIHEIINANDEIAELGRIVLEVTQAQYKFVTIT